MSVSPRLQALLHSLAQRYLPAPYETPEDTAKLARDLALHGVLVLPLRIPEAHSSRQQQLISELVSTYGSFYRLLTDVLFPSLRALNAYYADAHEPPVVVFEAAALPVTEAFANYVVPFCAARRPAQPVSIPELQGIVYFMLEDMEGLDVEPSVQRDLVQRGAEYLTRLLQLPVQQQALTPFLRKKYVYLAPEPPEIPTSAPPPPLESPRRPPPPPPMPPESPRPATAPLRSAIPILYDRDERTDTPTV